MKNLKFFKLLFAALLLSTAFSGCKRDDKDDDTGSASDNALAENLFNDVVNISEQAGDGQLESYKNAQAQSNCATVTIDTVLRHIEVDFGASNCLCADGRNRRGKILVDYTGAYRATGSVHTITFDNYFVNDNQILGSKTVTNNGPNNSGNLTFTIAVNGSIEKANNGGTITFVSNRTREWIAGSGTQVWSDDIYLLSGNGSGTTAAGLTYTFNITTPLRIELSCRHIVSGVLEFTPGSRATRTIDFGTGACDGIITVTVNGHTYTITLN